jgi:hypothetical protein
MLSQPQHDACAQKKTPCEGEEKIIWENSQCKKGNIGK